MENWTAWARMMAMHQADFYQEHLDRVSRSFAFCIARLDGDLRAWVGLSYLLCRVLDTVEDAEWDTSENQRNAFGRFRVFVEQGASRADTETWAAGFPASIPAAERALLNDSFRLFGDLRALPAEVSSPIRRQVMNMFRGMQHFSSRRDGEGSRLRLRSLAEVNQYCFFVAGLVGELLTDLFSAHHPDWEKNPETYRDAVHFGLFLQKVNLLKDQGGDENEGRFLVPNRAALLASASANAEGAARFLLSLPISAKGFRLFCGWSLFLGLSSLPWIERGRTLGAILKLPRIVTEKLLGTVEGVIDDNRALAELFRRACPKWPAVAPQSAISPAPWLEEIYQGRLDRRELAALGLVPA